MLCIVFQRKLLFDERVTIKKQVYFSFLINVWFLFGPTETIVIVFQVRFQEIQCNR